MASKTIIVSMTGEAGLTEQARTKLSGAYTCLHKPFTIDALSDIVDRFDRISTHRQRFYAKEQDYQEQHAAKRAEEAARPLIERLGRDLRRQGLSWKRLFALIVAMTVVAIIAIIFIRGSISTVSDKVQNLESFMGRMEGYLERDEQRELGRERRNPRP